MLRGIDVSVYQNDIDWAVVATTGEVDFAYARATIGMSVDIKFKKNWTTLKDSPIRRGAYHFYKMQYDPVKQAQLFFDTVGQLDDRDLPPTLDVEVHRMIGQSANDYVEKLLKFLDKAEELFGRRLIIYTGGPIFNECTKGADTLLLDAITSRDLWLSAYVNDPSKWVPEAWKLRGMSWTLWQKSGDVAANGKPGKRINGISSVVDYNVTQGEAEEMESWIANSMILGVNHEIDVEEQTHEVVAPKVPENPVHVEPDVEPVVEPPPPPVEPTIIVRPDAPKGLFGIIFSFFKMLIQLLTKGG